MRAVRDKLFVLVVYVLPNLNCSWTRAQRAVHRKVVQCPVSLFTSVCILGAKARGRVEIGLPLATHLVAGSWHCRPCRLPALRWYCWRQRERDPHYQTQHPHIANIMGTLFCPIGVFIRGVPMYYTKWLTKRGAAIIVIQTHLSGIPSLLTLR